MRVNRKRFDEVLDGEDGWWVKEVGRGKGKPFRYRRAEKESGDTLPA